MFCSQSDTILASIPWTILGANKYFPDANLLTKENGLKSLHFNEGGDKQIR